jgi:hypothetical protein
MNKSAIITKEKNDVISIKKLNQRHLKNLLLPRSYSATQCILTYQQSSDKIHVSNLVNLSGVRDNIKYISAKKGNMHPV